MHTHKFSAFVSLSWLVGFKDRRPTVGVIPRESFHCWSSASCYTEGLQYVIPDITYTERPLTVFSNPGLERVSTFQGVNCGLEIKSKLNQQSSSGGEDLHNFSASL